jgi:hypothetical protein
MLEMMDNPIEEQKKIAAACEALGRHGFKWLTYEET